jgi:hypothetical protein
MEGGCVQSCLLNRTETERHHIHDLETQTDLQFLREIRLEGDLSIFPLNVLASKLGARTWRCSTRYPTAFGSLGL